MATYIVGDIQACLSGLQKLLKKVNFCPKTDKLIAVGDLIGRGPEALDTLEYLMGLGNNFDTVLGNHDLHFLAIYAGVRKAKASDKFDDLLASPKIETYIDWLRQKPLALTLDKQTLICHAGLYPQWSIKQGVKYSKEISQILGSSQWKIFLANMYGSQPNIWHDKLKGAERNRFIVNAFTRMRFLEQKSALNFDCKSTPEDAPKKLEPWFNITNSQLTKHQSIIFGHWAALQGKTRLKNIIGLDTGYLWGLSMTLLDFDTKIKYSVENKEK
ncbi:symmetrical bis(5'-nucleosyl)-tetraphosphatase [Paraglaciecola aquimarina]|uniref:bis(5'-nucleosyl)-tetraphosphatase (symmetrical) n=1 Tax=Paraglaciecola algarum TaxID=3050085 RepID=A0ABS9D9Q3_9ALTE|nr:symmetrical bis(5'-nucleosyl)-tetraphosphatase [Paraglaciecola sp. G1-23]MCF2949707.1 symmetrical bis(5'-nucleosyl)-tetraphosphatase [Paraglaciecola sp. G1-23]